MNGAACYFPRSALSRDRVYNNGSIFINSFRSGKKKCSLLPSFLPPRVYLLLLPFLPPPLSHPPCGPWEAIQPHCLTSSRTKASLYLRNVTIIEKSSDLALRRCFKRGVYPVAFFCLFRHFRSISTRWCSDSVTSCSHISCRVPCRINWYFSM